MHGYKEYVLGFMFDDARQNVLLINENKPESLKGKWNGIGGKVEKYEPDDVAMVREFQEEVGITTTLEEWEHCLRFTGPDSSIGCKFVINVFRAFGNPWAFRQMEAERPMVFMLSELERMNIVDNLRWMVPMLADRRVEFPLAIAQS